MEDQVQSEVQAESAVAIEAPVSEPVTPVEAPAEVEEVAEVDAAANVATDVVATEEPEEVEHETPAHGALYELEQKLNSLGSYVIGETDSLIAKLRSLL